MLKAARLISLLVLVAFAISSCTIERQCKVKKTKAKWKHYNSLQFGSGKKH